jgi:hypothetical protein
MAISICSSVGANTGDIDCDIVRGNPLVLIPGSAEFDTNDTVDSTTFEAAFTAKINQAAGTSDKLFPFPVIQGVTDKTEAAKYGTLGYGLQVKLLRSKQGYEFDVLAGSALEKRLMAFDGKQVPFFILDDNTNYNLWGVQNSNVDFAGALYQVGVEPRGFGDGNSVKTTKITISIIDPRDFVENARVAPTSFAASDLKGLNDVTLAEAATHAANVHYIKMYVATAKLGNGEDVTAQFGSAIASASLWTAKTGTGYTTTLAITSVTYDSTNNRLVFTFDSTAYTALSTGATIKLIPDPVEDLFAADIVGIEPVFIILTKTA